MSMSILFSPLTKMAFSQCLHITVIMKIICTTHSLLHYCSHGNLICNLDLGGFLRFISFYFVHFEQNLSHLSFFSPHCMIAPFATDHEVRWFVRWVLNSYTDNKTLCFFTLDVGQSSDCMWLSKITSLVAQNGDQNSQKRPSCSRFSTRVA